MSQPDADVSAFGGSAYLCGGKNSDTLWRYRKNFKFLKEVKILSEFFHSKLACLITAVQITKKLTVTVAIYPVALCSVRGMER